MPSNSKSQKKLFQMVYAYKSGGLKLSDSIDIRELRDIWNSINVYRLHIFVQSIIRFRKNTFKDKNLINT